MFYKTMSSILSQIVMWSIAQSVVSQYSIIAKPMQWQVQVSIWQQMKVKPEYPLNASVYYFFI